MNTDRLLIIIISLGAILWVFGGIDSLLTIISLGAMLWAFGGILWWLVSYPNQKIEQVSRSSILEVDGADVRYPDLELGCLGIPCEVGENRRIQVVFPTLTPEGDLKYIYSWHNLTSVRIPAFSKTSLEDEAKPKAVEQLATLVKEHLQLQSEIINLTKQWQEVKDLLYLIATSDFYASQQEIYARALSQVDNLLDMAEQLEQVYIRFIRERLIGHKIAGYNPDLLPDGNLIITDQYERIREEYMIMKNTASAYSELLSTRKA
jgi:hypothetical protein